MFNPVDSVALLTKTVQNDPNFIVKPIAVLLGYILNFVFNIVDVVSKDLSMGIAIILFTIIVRLLMLPIAFKQQKSMAGMQKIQPEIEKIRKKYGSSKDPEIQKKMQAELQALYAKHNINPFGGCLPLLVQFPIFIALMYIMNQPYMFIKKLGNVYNQIAQSLLSTIDLNLSEYAVVVDLIKSKLGSNISDFSVGLDFPGNFEKVLNIFTPDDWNRLLTCIPLELQNQIIPLLEQKNLMEHFGNMNMQSVPGWGVGGIIMIILSVGSSFLSSWVIMRQSKNMDETAKTQQKVMLFMMPVMMGYFTVTMPAGVGVYWITSSVVQVFQQLALNKYYNRDKEV